MSYTNAELNNFTRTHAQMCLENGKIDAELYEKFGVKRGLRDKNGQGVIAGLTAISEVLAVKETPEGR